MRLSLKMTALTALVGSVVFGIYGAWLVIEERHDLQVSVERELSFLGTSLRVGIENAIRDRQIADIEEATLRLEGIDTQIDVFVYSTHGTPVVAPTGVPDDVIGSVLTEMARATSGDQETILRYYPTSTPTRLLLATPLLTDDGESVGALVISRPLDDMNRDLLETAGYIAATVGIFLLMAIGLGLYIGELRLAQPLMRLANSMQAIRSGKAIEPLEESGDDELVAVTQEFNQMLVDLQAAREIAATEAEKRREVARSLEAADRLITVGQLAASVAHEIGSPLQVLLGRARALEERPEDTAKVRRNARSLIGEAERITRIVEQLLSLTRRPAQNRTVGTIHGQAEVRKLIAEVLWLLELEARRRQATLEMIEGPPLWVSCDADQLRQVTLNLVRNALEAVSAGGKIKVQVGKTLENDEPPMAWISVEDDGSGIYPELLERIFEPLFTTRTEGGTGLGLAIVKGIADEHRGRVEVRSSPGRGAWFRFSWPQPKGF